VKIGGKTLWVEGSTVNLAMVLAILCICAKPHAGEREEPVQFHIHAQDLGSALNEFALQSGMEILFVEDEISGKATSEISGSFQPIMALEQLLANTDLRYRVNDLDTILVGNEMRVLTGERPAMSNSKNALQRLASGFAAVVLGSAVSTGTVNAADEEEMMEEIVVTGIRGSLQQSLERKRNSDHFVDAITAEDIGAFPDQNLAESLQRISGVAIDRKSGEGAFVSVRGLGPQFVQTTIHGRVSASNVAPGSHDGLGNNNTKSRAVGFHAFQSGLVQAVEVHKSPRADHVEGGLGGFIDVQPRRPLEIGKRQVAVSVDATRNELSDDTAPGVFAVFSDVLTDNLGFMVSAQWDNRFLRSDFLDAQYIGDPRTTTVNGAEMTGYYPNNINAQLHFNDRDRLNISSALQWQPSDIVDVTLDLLFTDNESDEARHLRSMRIGQGHPRVTDATVTDDNGTGIFTMISTSGAGAFIEHATEQVDAEAANIGLNMKVQATNNLSLNIDAALSETEAPITNTDALMRNTRAQMTYNKFGSGKLPSLTSSSPFSDVDFWKVVKQSFQRHLVDDRQSQFRLDATYEFDGDWLDTVQVGVRTYRQDRRDRSRYLNSKAFINKPVADFGGIVAFPVAEGDFKSGLSLNHPDTPIPNHEVLQSTFGTRTAEILSGKGFKTNAVIQNGVVTFNQDNFNEDLNHSDDGNAFYAMLTFSGEMGDTPYSGNIGVRYVDNSTQSVGEITFPIGIDYTDPSQPQVNLSSPEFVDVGHEYTETLPSLNMRFDPRDDIVVRVAVAKVLTRPRFLDLSPRQTVQANPRTTRGGNGKLDPTTATQFDVAVEWYFADYSIASVGLFTKDIEAFVQSQPSPTPFPGVLDPATGQPLVLTDFRPLNTGGSEVTGLEFAFQRTFADVLPEPFDGLGVVANYTYIDSGSDFKNEKTGASYSVPGLSENTINFTLFYEKGPWTGRVSYNLRDDFLDDINGGFSGHPRFVEKYVQWDVSFGYQLNENLSLSVEGINLTDENVYYYSLLGTGVQKHVHAAINSGTRYQAGIRWKL